MCVVINFATILEVNTVARLLAGCFILNPSIVGENMFAGRSNDVTDNGSFASCAHIGRVTFKHTVGSSNHTGGGVDVVNHRSSSSRGKGNKNEFRGIVSAAVCGTVILNNYSKIQVSTKRFIQLKGDFKKVTGCSRRSIHVGEIINDKTTFLITANDLAGEKSFERIIDYFCNSIRVIIQEQAQVRDTGILVCGDSD